MAISRIDLLNHKFSRSLRGYTPAEVDRMLQGLADTLGKLGDEKVMLTNRVVELEERLDEFRQREQSIQEMMSATQKMGEDLKAAAQQEAQLILESARTKADNLVNQGHMRLSRLDNEIAEAKKRKMQLILGIRTVIESHLQLLDMESEDIAVTRKPEPPA